MQNNAQRQTVKFDTFLQLVFCIFPLKVSQIRYSGLKETETSYARIFGLSDNHRQNI